MAIHPSASTANVWSAVLTHLHAQLLGPAGLPDQIPAADWWLPSCTFNPDDHDYYLRPVLIEGVGEQFAAVPDLLPGQPDDETPGEVKPWMLMLDLFVKRSCAKGLTTLDLALWLRSKDLIKSTFNGHLLLPVLDNHRGGASTGAQVGCLKYLSKEPRGIQKDRTWLSAGWAVQLETIEVDASV